MENNDLSKKTETNNLSNYRISLFRDSTHLKATERVAHLSTFLSWRFFQFGYSLKDVLTDYEKMEQVIVNHQQIYDFDAMLDFGSRNPYKIVEAMGESLYVYDWNRNAITYKNVGLCSTEELSRLISSPKKFSYEVLMPRRFPDFRNITPERFQKVVDEKLIADYYQQRLVNILANDYMMPKYAQIAFPVFPFELCINYYRGIKNTVLDMYERPEMFKDLIDSLYSAYYEPILTSLQTLPIGEDMNYCYDGAFIAFGHNYLNKNQFEKYFWPCMKQTLDYFVDKKKTVSVRVQGEIMRFKDYFRDYPAGTIALQIESDNIYKAKEAIPNCAFLGGSTLKKLGYASPQECVDEVKKVIDFFEFKGIVITQDKLGAYREDARPENLKAVSDFILNYRNQ